MSVVVMGMEMPGKCEHCLLADSAGIGLCRIEKRFWDPDPGQPLRPDWCPLRPLPEKHVRLGDLDVLQSSFSMLVESYERFSYELGNKRDYEVMKMADSTLNAFRSAERMTKELETIVEAEGME